MTTQPATGAEARPPRPAWAAAPARPAKVKPFALTSDYRPVGDRPRAIVAKTVAGAVGLRNLPEHRTTDFLCSCAFM